MCLRKVGVGGLLTLLLLVATAPVTVLTGIPSGGGTAWAQSAAVRSIKVEGNRRVEPETVRSYLKFSVGDAYDPLKVDQSLKALFATGLFADVKISREGGTVIITVDENPIVNQVAFEGNSELKDETLKSEIQLNSRAVFTRARVQSDVQRVLEVYRRSGQFAARVEPKIIKKEHNRVDLVFEITEGPKTTVQSIKFIGNEAFSDSQLREVISTTEDGLLSFLNTTNIYDPDRLNLDRELLRQYYLKNGYADARVVSATADLDRNRNGFFITFTIEEGEQYRFGTINVQSSLSELDPEAVRHKIETKQGKIYNAAKIDKTLENVTLEVSSMGYAFARVRPQVDRDPVARVISLNYVIEEGPRAYIERIEIRGNTRTLDRVIRREFRLAEGDAYNKLLVNSAKRRLVQLEFFKSVDITTEPGSAPDRVVIIVTVQEQPTGQLQLGGGYSTSAGAIVDVSLSERNLLGRGQYVKLRASGGAETLNVDFAFTEPYFMGRNMSAGIDLFHATHDLSDEASFSSKRTGGGVRLGIPINDDWQVSTNYTFKQEEIFDVHPNASSVIRASEGVVNVSSVGYSVSYDTRNHPRNPTQGLYFSVGQDLAGVGGDVEYLRTTSDLRGYYPINKDFTLVGRLQGGYVFGYGSEDVRLLDLFFKGGETIRGFERAGIGPRDLTSSNKDALGGTTFAASTVELRFPMPVVPEKMGLQGAVFADAGTLVGTGDLTGLDPGTEIANDSSIRSSVGFSLIWQSPLGPLRGDFAYALTKEEYDKEQFFHFGAATRF